MPNKNEGSAIFIEKGALNKLQDIKEKRNQRAPIGTSKQTLKGILHEQIHLLYKKEIVNSK